MFDGMREVFERKAHEAGAALERVFRRAILRDSNDKVGGQSITASFFQDDDPLDEIERAQPWGLSFVPPSNTVELIVAAIASNLDNLIAFDITDRTHRPKGNHRKPGTGGLYSLLGWFLFYAEDGKVRIGADSGGSPGADGAKVDAGLEVSPDKSVKLGGVDATERALNADAFMAKFDTLIGAIATAAAGTGGGVTSAINTALADFHATGDALMLSQKVKLK